MGSTKDIDFNDFIDAETLFGNIESTKMRFEDFFFFSSRVFFHGHWQLTGQQGNGGDLFFYSTLPLPPAHKHSDIYVQFCT